jgi:anti-sigma B factor antagonist
MLKVEQINNIYVASFENINRFNALITEPVKEQLNNLFNKPNTKLVLNLSGINFIDSSGFGVFLSVMKTANINFGQFKICNINGEVMELFKLLQLHNVFEIYSNLDDCLRSFNN